MINYLFEIIIRVELSVNRDIIVEVSDIRSEFETMVTRDALIYVVEGIRGIGGRRRVLRRRGIARRGLFMLYKVAIMVGEAEVLLCLLGIPTSCRPQAKRIPHLQLECSLDATADFLRRGRT